MNYDILELDELTLAYSCTIHKAQGSEYSIVIIPISFSHYPMLIRNLVYTGLTRAKKIAVFVGEIEALQYAINNNNVVLRKTMLSERLRQLI